MPLADSPASTPFDHHVDRAHVATVPLRRRSTTQCVEASSSFVGAAPASGSFGSHSAVVTTPCTAGP